MKTLLLTLLALTLAVPVVFADELAKPKAPEQPCLKIEQACTAAGFVKGGVKEGKGLIVDCMKPILEGKSILGVTVEPATVKACQEISKTRRETRAQKRAEAAGAKPEAPRAK